MAIAEESDIAASRLCRDSFERAPSLNRTEPPSASEGPFIVDINRTDTSPMGSPRLTLVEHKAVPKSKSAAQSLTVAAAVTARHSDGLPASRSRTASPGKTNEATELTTDKVERIFANAEADGIRQIDVLFKPIHENLECMKQDHEEMQAKLQSMCDAIDEADFPGSTRQLEAAIRRADEEIELTQQRIAERQAENAAWDAQWEARREATRRNMREIDKLLEDL